MYSREFHRIYIQVGLTSSVLDSPRTFFQYSTIFLIPSCSLLCHPSLIDLHVYVCARLSSHTICYAFSLFTSPFFVSLKFVFPLFWTNFYVSSKRLGHLHFKRECQKQYFELFCSYKKKRFHYETGWVNSAVWRNVSFAPSSYLLNKTNK